MKKKTRKKNSISRKMSPTVLLFTNGRTEEIYFKEFQRNENKSALVVKPIFANGEMSSFITEIKGQLRNSDVREYFSKADKVFFVFDFDNHTSEEIIETFKGLKEIAGKKARIYFSNFSFELWLLAHSQKVQGYKDQKQLQSALEKIYKIEKGKWGKHKTDDQLIKGIVTEWRVAVENCCHFENDLYQKYLVNPWTNIAHLFNEL
ncbi:RloB family protein [Lactococcus petauri]|nr:RloB family protein [Lactococcus petauri]